MIISCIYKPPNANVGDFVVSLEKLLDTLEKQKQLCYLAGDLNIDILKSDVHAPTADFVSLVDAQLHSSMRLISGTIWSTLLPWLPILTNIEPPALRRRADTDKLITRAECHRDWPLYNDVFHPPPLRLESCKTLWRDLQPIDVTSWWRVD